MELAQSGASGMAITDLPKRNRGLGVCAACVAEKSAHLPHKDMDRQVSILKVSIST